MAHPTIVFCHGAWHNVRFFDKVIGILEPLGYRCITVPLPSSSGRVPPTTSLDEDIAAIRNAVLKELDAGRDVVMNAHSWGGIPSNQSFLYPLRCPLYLPHCSWSAFSSLSKIRLFTVTRKQALTSSSVNCSWRLDQTRTNGKWRNNWGFKDDLCICFRFSWSYEYAGFCGRPTRVMERWQSEFRSAK